jgi:quinol-cytochrome oxidoreductase complex cytochrome b subunit/NADH:ubiquinone oxidoreductase subunit 2 (subunit N)
MSFYLNAVRNPLIATISNHIDTYPTPINFSYLWGFGSLAGVALGIQIVTGVLLAMHYAPEVHLAFTSVEHIMRDVKGGVALRYIHANGASMFFIVVYTHMFRGLYYGSYFQPRANLWYSGIAIFFLMMATAFMGYVLPWGQMSFWGATVITNLFSAIPGIGTSIVQLLWGGFSVDNPTLNRFFSLHYFLPFIIAGLAFLHLILLHQPGSNNPLGVNSIYDRIPFYPYYYVKDLFGFFMFIWIFSFFVIYAPNYMGHPDNYIEANPMVTPAHIVPEWYFLPFYAILRAVPDKLGGVLLMVIAIVILAILPLVDTSSFRSTFFKPLNLWFFWYFFADAFSLGWIGQEIVESPFIEMGAFVTISYFLYFIPLLPLIGFLENAVIQHELRYAALPVFFMFNEVSLLGGDELSFFFNWLHLFQVGFIAIFLLCLGIFFPKSGEFIRFLNKLAFGYLLFNIWRFSSDVVLRPVFDFSENFLGGIAVTADNFSENLQLALQIFQGDSLVYHLFALYASLMVSLFLYGISDRFFISNSSEVEFPILVFFIHLGALLLFSAHTFVDLVLALETVTLASYVLAAFDRKNRFSTYAGVQYFILGSIPSGMLVLGAGLLYKNWGVMALEDLDLLVSSTINNINLDLTELYLDFLDSDASDFEPNAIYWSILGLDELTLTFKKVGYYPNWDSWNTIAPVFADWEHVFAASSPYTFVTILAILFLFFNLFFKITAAPFHFWAPSVYGKAPLASVTFLSIFSKGMIFFFIFKIIFTVFYPFKAILTPLFLFCSVITVLFGMIGAFSEKVIKRFFVYSSMGHVGFMLIGLGLSSLEGASATFHYLPVYIISSFIMWFILLHMGRENNHLIHFKMLKNSDPLLALIFALLIFSMSGIPPLGGFY